MELVSPFMYGTNDDGSEKWFTDWKEEDFTETKIKIKQKIEDHLNKR